MVQKFRALAALADDWGSVLSTYLVAVTVYNSCARASKSTVHIHASKHSHTHTSKKSLL